MFGGSADSSSAFVVTEMYDPSTTLWILDGYDEIADRVPAHLIGPVKSMLDAPNRILTGRPHAMAGLESNLNVEVAGFNDIDVSDFVHQFFAQCAGSVLRQLRENRILWAMAHVPINLFLLCHSLANSARTDSEDALESTPTGTRSAVSFTQVYSAIDRLMMKGYTSRKVVGEVPQAVEAMSVLFCVVALQATLDGAVMIPGSTIGSVLQSVGGGSISWADILNIGVVTQADSTAQVSLAPLCTRARVHTHTRHTMQPGL